MKALSLAGLILIMLSFRTIAAKAQSDKRWELTAVGDIMLGRGVARAIDRNGQDYLFGKMPLIDDSCKILTGNLESVISSLEYQSVSPYRFRADPAVAGNLLKQNWQGFLAVANNHAFDCGPEGLLQSQNVLDSLNIPFSGTLVLQQATTSDSIPQKPISRPAFMRIGDIKIGFLAFCQPYLLFSKDMANMVAPADSATIVRSIQAIKDSCDMIIASFHWGYEYQQKVSGIQKKLGHLAIRNGVKIVLGHHPHVLQGLEFYRKGLIAYSLGNFIFDQKDSLAKQSAILHVNIRGTDIDSVWLEPIEIRAYRPVLNLKGTAFKEDIDKLNSDFKTRTKYIKDKLFIF